MAFASVGSFGIGNSVVSGTTLTLTPTGTVAVGRLAILIVGHDNLIPLSSNMPGMDIYSPTWSALLSVTDTEGNVWHWLQGSSAVTASAESSTSTEVWYSVITTQLTTGSTVTATFRSNIVAKAMTGWEFTIDGTDIAVEDAISTFSTGADSPSLTLTDLPLREYLFLRAESRESNDAGGIITPTTDYTEITAAIADGGSDALSAQAYGEFRILTGTGDTSDPDGLNFDGTEVFMAIYETTTPDIPWIVGGGRSVGTTVSGVLPNMPPHRTNDILLLVAECANTDSITFSDAQGFVAVTNSPQVGADTELSLFWVRATSGSMARPTFNDPGDHLVASVLCIRGCIASGDPWDVLQGETAAADTAITVSGVTTTVDNCLVLYFVSDTIDLTTARYSGWAASGLTRFRPVSESRTLQGDGGGVFISAGRKATAGDTGTMTATAADSTARAQMTVAFKPTAETPTMISVQLHRQRRVRVR